MYCSMSFSDLIVRIRTTDNDQIIGNDMATNTSRGLQLETK